MIRAFLIGTMLVLCGLSGPVAGAADRTRLLGVDHSEEPGSAGEDSLEISGIFRDVEAAVLTSTPDLLSKHFSRQIYLSVRSVAEGYYSSNQAHYLLRDFLNNGHIRTFKFTTIEVTGQTPYATGGGTTRRGGESGIVQLYVSLSKTGGRWMIARLSIF